MGVLAPARKRAAVRRAGAEHAECGAAGSLVCLSKPAGPVTKSRQVWPQLTTSLVDRGKLPTGIVLPFNTVWANLGGVDGGGMYLT